MWNTFNLSENVKHFNWYENERVTRELTLTNVFPYNYQTFYKGHWACYQELTLTNVFPYNYLTFNKGHWASYQELNFNQCISLQLSDI